MDHRVRGVACIGRSWLSACSKFWEFLTHFLSFTFFFFFCQGNKFSISIQKAVYESTLFKLITVWTPYVVHPVNETDHNRI